MEQIKQNNMERMCKRRTSVLVIGQGFVGRVITEALNVEDNDVFKALGYNYIQYDSPFLIRDIEKVSPDVIINTVGYTGSPNVDGCEENKLLTAELNVRVPLKLAQYCETKGIYFINIGSGCIYDSASPDEKIEHFREYDTPNFGMFNKDSSTYSKTKDMCEFLLKAYEKSCTFRIRMPIADFKHPKCYINKIIKYDTLINCVNSKTSLNYLSGVLKWYVYEIIKKNNKSLASESVINVVHNDPLLPSRILEILTAYNVITEEQLNSKKYIKCSELDVKARRSNCILRTDVLSHHSGPMISETEMLIEELRRLKFTSI
jgi:dTDP-4-dehydrorhamnose reductase